MSDATSACRVVLCTAPPDVAPTLADRLLGARLAACVNLLPGVESRYIWEGQPEVERETLMVIKTARATVEELVETLADWHPYDVPEVLVVPVESGLAGYLAWVNDTCRGPGGTPPAND